MIDRQIYEIIKITLGEDHLRNYPNDFSIRIIVQKVLYLLTHGKSNPQIKLPYTWTFYLRGPYCSDIAHMIYHMNDVWSEIQNVSYTLTPQDEASIDNWKKLDNEINSINGNYNYKRPDLYEAIATLIYITDQVGNNLELVLSKFNEFKPQLKENLSPILNDLYNLLTKYGYC